MMDEFTLHRYTKIAEWYLDILAEGGTQAALDMVWNNISSGNEIKEKFIPFLKDYARERGCYV